VWGECRGSDPFHLVATSGRYHRDGHSRESPMFQPVDWATAGDAVPSAVVRSAKRLSHRCTDDPIR
jgi:hypothetical protein